MNHCNTAKRDDILDNVSQLFARHGYQNTNVKLLAKEAQASTSTIYTYFDYKTDLLSQSIERLQALNIRPHWCINHGPNLSMYYLGPMKNQMELQIDNMTPKEAIDFAKSDPFQANPIGIEFIPEELNERRKADESAATLTAYT